MRDTDNLLRCQIGSFLSASIEKSSAIIRNFTISIFNLERIGPSSAHWFAVSTSPANSAVIFAKSLSNSFASIYEFTRVFLSFVALASSQSNQVPSTHKSRERITALGTRTANSLHLPGTRNYVRL